MFYCEACRKERKWPGSLVQSYGPCEVCHQKAQCYDTPSSHLPVPAHIEDAFKKGLTRPSS